VTAAVLTQAVHVVADRLHRGDLALLRGDDVLGEVVDLGMLGLPLGEASHLDRVRWCSVMSVTNAASVLLSAALELSLSPPQPGATAASAMRLSAASSATHVLVFMVSCPPKS